MSEDIPGGCGKDVSTFHKGEIIGLHQAKTVQRIIKTWKDSGEPSSPHQMWLGKKSGMNVTGDHIR